MHRRISVVIWIMMMSMLPILNAQECDDNWIQTLSDEEFQQLLTYQPFADYVEPPLDPSLKDRDFPAVFDWREMNGVSSVKNQASCGSCWAFASIAVLESQVLIQTGQEMDFAEQQLVDCTPLSYGCSGGITEMGWEYLLYMGLVSEEEYPYQAEDTICKHWQYARRLMVTSWEFVNSSEESIKAAIQDFGPVATSMGANDNLRYYSGGCYMDDSNTDINHGVVIVGWDDTMCEGGAWIVKNSWGRGFGENGYFYIHRGDVHIGEQVSLAHIRLLPAVQVQLDDYKLQSGDDGIVASGESATLKITLTNTGYMTASTVSATLSCASDMVTFTKNRIDIEEMASMATVSTDDSFVFNLDSDLPPGTVLPFLLNIRSGDIESQHPIEIISGPLYWLYRNDFEGTTDELWTHQAVRGKDIWVRGQVPDGQNVIWDPIHPASGTHMWSTNIDHGGNYLKNADHYLESPIIPCYKHPTVFMVFRRWLTLEKGEFDHALIWVNGQKIWENTREYYWVDNTWEYCIFDISPYISEQSTCQVRFELKSDEALELGGWNIDDFGIAAPIDDSFYNRFPSPVRLNLQTSQYVYSAGDHFDLRLTVDNYQSPRRVREWIALDVYGHYWFSPGWTESPDFNTIELPGWSRQENSVLSFEWPIIDGHAGDIRFWSAIQDMESNEVLAWDMVRWGW